MHYGAHVYEDFSHLNAKWQEERPAVAGLGVVPWGAHDYYDVSFLNARLRPIEPAGIGSVGAGTLRGNALAVRGLGEDSAFPWREYTKETQELQLSTNMILQREGYVTLAADGKLGPATCGAVKMVCDDIIDGGCEPPSTCQSFQAPVKQGSPRSGGSSPKAPPTSVARLGGGPNYLMLGGAIAAVAVGGALLLKAGKKRR